MWNRNRKVGQCKGTTGDSRTSLDCPYDAKPGEDYCGRHLAGQKRSQQARERWAREASEREQQGRLRRARLEREGVLADLTKNLVDEVRRYARAKYDGRPHGDGNMLLALDVLERVEAEGS